MTAEITLVQDNQNWIPDIGFQFCCTEIVHHVSLVVPTRLQCEG